jgi:hypothetical protein
MHLDKPILLSTAYMPPLHYFALIAAAPAVVIEKHETYLKQSYRNRCEIYTANGKLALTIPVVKTNGNHTRIDDIVISTQSKWQLLHWRAVRTAYANSPYFLYYADDIAPFYQRPFTSLFDFNLTIIHELLAMTGIEKELSFTADYEKHPVDVYDFRYSISPKVPPAQFRFQPYYQVFDEKYGFAQGLSMLDLLFNMGSEAGQVLQGLEFVGD